MTPSGTDEKTGPLAFCVASGLFLPARGMGPELCPGQRTHRPVIGGTAAGINMKEQKVIITTMILHMAALFLAKFLDNVLGTTKTILIQRGKCVLAGAALAASNYIAYSITKSIVTADNNTAILVVSVASGVGCCLAMAISKKLSKDRLFVNVIMSDNREAVQELRDFLALHHITNVAADSYTLDWETKTITITAYAETKAESELINGYLDRCPQKFKRVIQK